MRPEIDYEGGNCMFEKQSGSLQETASATGVAVPHAQESCVIYFFFFAAHSDLGEILTP